MSLARLNVEFTERDYYDRILSYQNPFILTHGGSIDDLKISYRIYGDPAKPLVLVLGGISANRIVIDSPDEKGWWQEALVDNALVTSDQYALLSIDYLGGSGLTTDGEAVYSLEDFAYLDTKDQARIIHIILEDLQVQSLHSIVGASYGGLVACQFARLYPNKVEQIVVLNAAHKSTALANAWRYVQRQVLKQGIEQGHKEQALALARSLAVATYKGGDELEQRFGHAVNSGAGNLQPEHTNNMNAACQCNSHETAIESYLRYQGEKIVSKVSAEAFYCLSESIDRHQVDASKIVTPIHVVSTDTDQLVPPGLITNFLLALPQLKHHKQIRSPKGHDAFLTEYEIVSEILNQIFSTLYTTR